MVALQILATIGICVLLILIRMPEQQRLSFELWDTASIHYYSTLIKSIKPHDSSAYRARGYFHKKRSMWSAFPKTSVPNAGDDDYLKCCLSMDEEYKIATEQFLANHQRDFLPIVIRALPKLYIETRQRSIYDVPPHLRSSSNWPREWVKIPRPSAVIHFTDQFCILACMLCRIIGTATANKGRFPWLNEQLKSAFVFISLMAILNTRSLSYF